ncbi:glycoside hydrolase family 3 C-terminal domain-containing protein [Lentzea sp. BCCO 10_0798]|uniref:Glycoside hydrolase family 3 C-terminal domain-containing protein n=1 Tax=Lentzea kristufekii TaxID=3095430 RepID=A0ABU4U3E2_9PSEU|nr:glycoside hydrolase family 3 C-terminal domain-containing protein [Lentzea sp. BCCO 10_0798]MDX8055089.1 glycoside hydrolase family 3 C-terminal domain-containing protein [Lentzea sp. BCCO 10_0798]
MGPETTVAHRNPALPLPVRVADLLARLTTAEKIAMLHQHQPAVPRLGIAAFRTGTEALHGVAGLGTATVFPQAIGLASTWNPDLVRAVGDATGTEVRGFHEKDPVAHGLNVWAPVVNPLRDPRWGRNEEGYSENPLLTSVMAIAYASGLRGDAPRYLKTAPTLKHFLGYNHETDRYSTSSSLRDRVLHEYELPCLLGPIAAGAAVAVMPSYNLVNGRPAHLTPYLDELRGWATGEIAEMSDAWAPSNVAGLQCYHDNQVDGRAAMLPAGIDSFTDHDADPSVTIERVSEALRTGLIGESDVDRVVGRVLTVRFRLGEFDPPGANPYAAIGSDVIASPAHRELALEAARQSIVLLKNDDGLLPLGSDQPGTLAVIGTHAGVLFEDWHSGKLPYQVTPLDGLAELHNGPTHFAEGVDRVTLSTGDGRYLTAGEDGTVTAEPGWTASAAFEVLEWGQDVVTLRGVSTGRYLAATEDGELVVDRTAPGGWVVREQFELTELPDGRWSLRNIALDRHLAVGHDGRIGFVPNSDEATALWLEVERDGVAQAVARASAADVAIVFVGNEPHINERETQDRVDLELPPRQAELVRAVRQANPLTVLVVVSSYPYALVREDRGVPAILWASHGGQEFGRAGRGGLRPRCAERQAHPDLVPRHASAAGPARLRHHQCGQHLPVLRRRAAVPVRSRPELHDLRLRADEALDLGGAP